MKNKLTIIALIAICVLGACKKDGTGTNGGGAPITDETGAKALFSKMNSLWTNTLGPVLSETNQTYTNKVLNGTSGTATVNGSYSVTRASSSSSSLNASTADVIITFKDYESDGLHINGTVRFFDYSNVRTACSSSGCATSSHSRLAYSSHDGSNNSFGQANVRFEDNGKSYQDAILMDIGKTDNFRWSIEVTNSNNQTISTSY
jgi:hypothetical protein